MIWILLQNKLRIFFNGIRKGTPKKRFFRLFGFLFTAGLFFILFQWAYDFFSIILFSPKLNINLPERILVIEKILTYIFNGLFLFMFMGGISISIHYLFSSADLTLLLPAPISLDTVFAYKIVETITFNAGLFLLFGGAILFGLSFLISASPGFLLLLILGALAYIVIPTTGALLLALWIIRFFPPRRVQELSSALTGILGLGIWLLIQFFRASVLEHTSADFNAQRLNQIQQLAHSPIEFWSPGTWISSFVKFQLQPESGFPIANILSLFVLSASFFSVCVRLARKQFLKSGFINEQSYRSSSSHSPNKIRSLKAGKQKPSSIFAAFIIKDIRLMFRDPRQLVQTILFMLIMILVTFVLHDNSDNHFGQFYDGNDPIFVLLFLMIFMSAQTASRLIPLDGKAFWLMKQFPVSEKYIIATKYVLCLGLNQLLLSAVIVVIALFYKLTFSLILYYAFLSLITNLGGVGIGIIVGSFFPRFEWEHPKKMLTPAGTVVLFLLIIIWYAILLAIQIVGVELAPTGNIINRFIFAYSALSGLLTTVLAFWIAAHRIKRIEVKF